MNMMLSSTEALIFLFFILVFIAASAIIHSFLKKERIKKVKENILRLADNATELTPQEFVAFKQNNDDFAGVYILYNTNKGFYYIGQAKKILYRVTCHLSGRGNGDVYSDYKYGDAFTIRLLKLDTSGYSSLNQLEKDAILTFDSYYNGYNKTRGNIDGGGWSFFHPYTKLSSKYSRKQILILLKKCAQGMLEDTFDVYEEIRIGLLPYANDMDFEGIYIIYNKTKNLYYVGSSTKNIFAAIHRHFTGKGNNDVYADYQHGDLITIKTLSISYSDYDTLEEMVKKTKKEYSTKADDYSKSRKPLAIPTKQPRTRAASSSSEEKQRKYAQSYFDRLQECSAGTIRVLAYNGSNKKLTAHCNKCGNEWIIRADHLLLRTYCPLCRKAEKAAEKHTTHH